MRTTLLAVVALLALPLRSQTPARVIDFRFAPTNSFSLICLPDDWQKSVITRAGALGYDFGPGPYARPLTLVSVEAQDESLEGARQWLPDGRVPFVHTTLRTHTTTSEQLAFALIPDAKVFGLPAGGRVSRIGGLNGCRAWANPPAPCDPLFRSVAWGTNRPILYRIRIPRGSTTKIALGFCEPYKSRPGSRLLDCRVEGAPHRVVDPLQSGIPQTPHVEFFDGFDEDRDGLLSVEVHPVQGSDPNVILNAFWLFPDSVKLSAADVVSGRASSNATLAYSCGLENEEAAIRCDALVATIRGADVAPQIRIRTRLSLTYDRRTGAINAEGRPFLFCRPAPDSIGRDAQGWRAPLRHGTRQVEVIAVHGKVSSARRVRSLDLAFERKRALRWWKDQRIIPRSPISVGDSTIQFLLDANLRNLYQAREKVDGFLQFQPGPSVYRGLWVGDVVLSGLPSLMFGDTLSLRLMLENAFRFQLPTGQINVMVPTASLSETPFVLTAMIWYAWMRNDEAWLRTCWVRLRDGIRWIRSMREETMRDEGAPYRGLMPPGFVDGGISNLTADYGTVFWSLTALELAAEAAQRLGHESDATEWSRLAKELHRSLEISMQRDVRRDATGNLYLPVAVGDTAATPPERGQYAFLLPLRYGPFLQQRTSLLDTVVRGTLKMLDATRVEGLIANSGWLSRGLWPWLGTAHALACQVMDDREKSIDLLYAVANHASEPGTWVEEQLPKSLGTTWTGDGSNAEASGMFLHLVRNALLFERLDTLHCLASVSAECLANGTVTSINNAPTLFGPVSLSVTIARDGTGAIVRWHSPGTRHHAGAVLHLDALRTAGFRSMDGMPLPERMALRFGESLAIRFRRP